MRLNSISSSFKIGMQVHVSKNIKIKIKKLQFNYIQDTMLERKIQREAVKKKMEKYIFDQSVNNQFYHEKKRKSPYAHIQPLFPHSPSPNKTYHPMLNDLSTPKSSKSPHTPLNLYNSNSPLPRSPLPRSPLPRSPINTLTPKAKLISIVEEEKTLQKYFKALRKKDLKNFPSNFAITKEGKIVREDELGDFEYFIQDEKWMDETIVKLFEYLISVNLTKRNTFKENNQHEQSSNYSKSKLFGNSLKTNEKQDSSLERQVEERSKISINKFKKLFQSFETTSKDQPPLHREVQLQRPQPLQISTVQEKLEKSNIKKNSQKQANLSKRDSQKDSRSRVFTFSSKNPRQTKQKMITPEKSKQKKVNEVKIEKKEKIEKQRRNRSHYCIAPVEEDTSLHQKYENTLKRLQVLKEKVYYEHGLRQKHHKQQDQSVDLIHMYKKYSPLKKLTKLMGQKKNDRKQNK